MAFAKFMNKKDFHPGSKANIKRAWMAEQKTLSNELKQKELQLQYEKEQQRFNNRQLVSKDERIKSGLDFLYDAPPGYKKEEKKSESDDKEEVKFEWQKGAPREAYAKNLGLAAKDQPFGIPVRNVKCIKCGKWGHVNTDRECPMFNQQATSDVDALDIADPLRLLKEMRSDGLTLKQNVLGRVYNPKDPNQQILASDEDDEEDPEAAFLASLTDKQKRKLLRKLDKMERQESDSHKHKKKKKKKRTRHSSNSEAESSEGDRSTKNRSRKRSQCDVEEREKQVSRKHSRTDSEFHEEGEKRRRSTRRYSESTNSDGEKDKKHRKKAESEAGKTDQHKQQGRALHEDRNKNRRHGDDRSPDRERHRDRHQRNDRRARERRR